MTSAVRMSERQYRALRNILVERQAPVDRLEIAQDGSTFAVRFYHQGQTEECRITTAGRVLR